MPGVNFLLALLAASGLSQARAHLAAGKLDAVLIDLQETQGDPGEEARVLTQAAERAKARSGPSGAGNADDALALLLAQTAMRRSSATAMRAASWRRSRRAQACTSAACRCSTSTEG
jgi:hypothetical protein